MAGSADGRYRGKAPPGQVPDRVDRQADGTVVDAGDGLADADGCLISEAGREAEHCPLSARAWQSAGVRFAGRGFPADAGRPDAGVIDAGADVKARNSCSGGAGGRPFPGAERFIGRADELRQVLAACAAAEGGHGSLIAVSGEAGIGKTRFCEEVMGRARHGGLTVVYARCWADGGAPALWPWQQILAGLCGSDAVGLLERDARRVAAGPGRFGRFVAVTDQLAVACRRSPACVIIDDVHAAGPGALLLLRFVARSLARVRLALVITRRRDRRRSDGSAALLDEIEREGMPLGLRHFDLTETTEFLAARGLGDLDPALFLVLLRVTGGNPLFLRRVAALGAPGPAQPVPAGLRAAIDEAFQRLEPATRQVVQAAAVLGLAPSVVEAAAVAGTSVAAVLEAAGRAARAGLVSREQAGRFSFSHELVRAAAEDALATLDRVEAHARAAAVLAGDASIAPAGRLARRAYHALRAAPRSAADARQAVAACRAAATSMIGSFAYERADALLSTAIELHDSLDLGSPAASLLVQWAEAALLCGRLAEARARFGRAASAADRDKDPRTFAEAVLGLGGVWVSEHRSAVDRARVLGLQRAALARLPAGDSVLRCRLRTRLAAEAVYDGAPARRRALLGRASPPQRRRLCPGRGAVAVPPRHALPGTPPRVPAGSRGTDRRRVRS
jgi:hypothetical protein